MQKKARSFCEKIFFNFGSLNIDHVYAMDHFVRPGETLSSSSLQIFSVGKGANQSVALVRSGANVYHEGKVGHDGKWLKEKLEEDKVNTEHTLESKSNNGHAIIQVDQKGENAIILFSWATKEIEPDDIDKILNPFSEGDYLLLQNEINLVDLLIRKGHEKKMKVCLNPDPMEPAVHDYPLELVEVLIVNEIEGSGLLNKEVSEDVLNELSGEFPEAEILLTLGSKGVHYAYKGEVLTVPAEKTTAVDTTAAGDTFIGYYLASKMIEKSTQECLEIATRVSEVCITRLGAQSSIPKREEVFEPPHG